MKKTLLGFLLLSAVAPAQNMPLARNAFMGQPVQDAFDYWIVTQPNTRFHSSFRPYLGSTFETAADSLLPFRAYSFRNTFLRRPLNKSVHRHRVLLQVHPLLDAEVGYDGLLKKTRSTLAAGSHLKLEVDQHFTLAATLIGGQLQLPFFLDTGIAAQKILPEVGQAYGAGAGTYAFFDYTGYVSYSPNKSRVFNLQLGRDKHFVGEGYRSLLLSDFGPAMPYFRVNANLWRFQYNVWYTWMLDPSGANGRKHDYKNKFGTFHYLSYNILPELNVGFFENIVWRGTDTNQVRSFELHYLNPVLLFRPQEYAVGSSDNSFIGLNINATLLRRLKLYGQLALDEFFLREIRARRGWWANKQGWQLGAKYLNAFGIRGLKLQIEHNQVRPYTYTHGVPQQNYAHYGYALAHPLGANFREYLGILAYRHKAWELSAQGQLAVLGKDSLDPRSNVGQNIFLSYTTRPFDYGHKTAQGVKTTVLQGQVKFTWFLVPDLNLRAEVGYIQRSETNANGYRLENPFVFIGLRSSFWNSYRDF